MLVSADPREDQFELPRLCRLLRRAVLLARADAVGVSELSIACGWLAVHPISLPSVYITAAHRRSARLRRLLPGERVEDVGKEE